MSQSEGPLTARLATVFAETFDIPLDSVHPAMEPADVPQWDSLGHARLIGALEKTFSRELSVDDIIAMTSFGAIVKIFRASEALG